MIAVTIDRITISYSATPVVSDLSWEVHDDRIVELDGGSLTNHTGGYSEYTVRTGKLPEQDKAP